MQWLQESGGVRMEWNLASRAGPARQVNTMTIMAEGGATPQNLILCMGGRLPVPNVNPLPLFLLPVVKEPWSAEA